MFRIALCDDNEEFLYMEQKIIMQYMKINKIEYQVDLFYSGQELLNLGNRVNRYHLIFLDVEMKMLDGIETAKKVRETSNVPIAFVTAYLSYSLDGYKVNAVRYILKEMGNFRVSIYECLDFIIGQYNKNQKSILKFNFREMEKEINLQNLVYIESHLHYCYFYIKEGEKLNVYTKREKLDEIERQIYNESFLRIHKSFLVNASYIINVKRYQVQLSIDKSLLIAQSKYLEVEKGYLDFCGKID